MRTTYGNALELIIPEPVAEELKGMEEFAMFIRNNWRFRGYDSDREKRPEYFANLNAFSEDQLRILSGLCHKHKEVKMEKTVQAVINYDRPIPGYDPAYSVMFRWLQEHCPSGWVFKRDESGMAWPYLITRIHAYVPDGRDKSDRPCFTISANAKVIATEGVHRRNTNDAAVLTMTLYPGDVTRKKVSTIMANHGWLVETPELLAAYNAAHEYAKKTIENKRGEQFRLDRSEGAVGRKCILDTKVTDYDDLLTMRDEYLCASFMRDDYMDETRPIPVHPNVSVFMLDVQEWQNVTAGRLVDYVYDPEMVNKLILPETHMDMLDVLTSDLDAFMSDIVEGKMAGNIILCKGIPGIGKTLTAEVYSEAVQRPIYSVHSGSLGTTPSAVEKELRTIFDRVMRWNCILLLDEADVFVGQRGNDLVQNAIVSVFLRLLEYFGGLMFMTTNRSDNIDDALISRCAAIIDYGVPSRKDTAAIWSTMAAQQGVTLTDSLVQQLLEVFPSITPRDIKHLLRLTLRVQARKGGELSIEGFRQTAMFRAVEVADVPNIPKDMPAPRKRRTRPAPETSA